MGEGQTRSRRAREKRTAVRPVLGWAGLIASTVAQVYLVLVLALGVIAGLPAVFGWHATVIQTGSMRPHIDPGDVVVLAPWAPEEPVPMGRVVQYRRPASAEADGVERLRLHRIVDAHEDGTLVTAGDANAELDSTPLHREQITGQARLLVPYIGLPSLWWGTQNLTALTGWALGTLAAVVAVATGRGGREPETSDPEDDNHGDGHGGDEGDGTPPARPGPAASTAPGAPSILGRQPTAGVRTRAWRLGTVVAILAVLVMPALSGTPAFSSAAFTASTAAFTASTASTANTFAAAPDWTGPSVVVTDPGPSVRGTTALTAEAADAQTGIREVRIEYALGGDGAWTTLCTSTTAPYSCTWNTQSVPDGAYRLRAVATDHTGLSTTSAVVQTQVANHLTVVLANPGEIQRGTVPLTATVYNPAGATPSVRIEYSAAGTNRWSTLCTATTAPYSCAWNTTGFANGSYDLRAVIGTGGNATYSEIIPDVLVDNQAPTVTMTDPGTPLSGTRTITATATDAHSGVGQVQLQYARTGTTAWTTLCTVTGVPYSCRFDTTTVADGTYSLRAIATDAAGNTTTSPVITNRVIDNTISSASVEDPGPYLTGVVPLRAVANSTAGVSNVSIQSAPAGTTTWSTRCTDTTAPYTCDWDTGTVTDGLYDLRAILTDGTGRQTISATVTGRRVDNSPLRGIDVQTTNGPGTIGRLEAGDTLALTYSQPVDLTTITPGWTAGTTVAVTVRLRDGTLTGTGSAGDTLDLQRPGSTVNLGTVNLKQNYINHGKTATVNATMTAITQTIQGVPRTVITLTLDTTTSGANTLRTTTTPATMTWHPTAAVTNTTGTASSTAPVNETGTPDLDF